MKKFKLLLAITIALPNAAPVFAGSTSANASTVILTLAEAVKITGLVAVGVAGLAALGVGGAGLLILFGNIRNGTWPTSKTAQDALNELGSSTPESLGLSTAQASDYTSMVSKAVNTGNMSGIEDYLAQNPQLFEAVKPAALAVASAELGINTQQAVYKTLIEQLDPTGSSTPTSFQKAISDAKDLLTNMLEAPDDVLPLAQNPDVFPEGAPTDLFSRINLIKQALTNSQGPDAATIETEEQLKAATEDIINSKGPSGPPVDPTEPVINTGGAGGDLPPVGSDAFNALKLSNVTELQAMQALKDSGGTVNLDDLNALRTTIVQEMEAAKDDPAAAAEAKAEADALDSIGKGVDGYEPITEV